MIIDSDSEDKLVDDICNAMESYNTDKEESKLAKDKAIEEKLQNLTYLKYFIGRKISEMRKELGID